MRKLFLWLVFGFSLGLIHFFPSENNGVLLSILPALPVALAGVRPLAQLGAKIAGLFGKLSIKNDNVVFKTRDNVLRKMRSIYGKNSGVEDYLGKLLSKYKIQHSDVSKRGKNEAYYNEKLKRVAMMCQEIIEDVFPQAKGEFEKQLEAYGNKLYNFDNAFIAAVDTILKNKLYESKITSFGDSAAVEADLISSQINRIGNGTSGGAVGIGNFDSDVLLTSETETEIQKKFEPSEDSGLLKVGLVVLVLYFLFK